MLKEISIKESVRVAQSVACLTEEPLASSAISGPAHTFVEFLRDSRRAVVSYWRKYGHLVLVNRLGV